MSPGVHLTSAPSPSTAPESAQRFRQASTAPTASSAAGTRSNLNSQENAFSGQSATNAASHGAYAVRVAQIAATVASWNGIITIAFAVFVEPPPTHASNAKRSTAPSGYSERG